MNLKVNPKKLEAMALKFVSAGLMLIFVSLFNEEASQWYQTRSQPSGAKTTIVLVASVIGFAASLESWLTAYDNEET